MNLTMYSASCGERGQRVADSLRYISHSNDVYAAVALFQMDMEVKSRIS